MKYYNIIFFHSFFYVIYDSSSTYIYEFDDVCTRN